MMGDPGTEWASPCSVTAGLDRGTLAAHSRGFSFAASPEPVGGKAPMILLEGSPVRGHRVLGALSQ